MKPLKLITMMSCVCLMVGVVGCSDKSSRGSGSSTYSSSGGSETSQGPGDVVLGFLKALKAGKPSKAYGKEYVRDEYATMRAVRRGMDKKMDDWEQTIIKFLEDAKFTVTDTKIDDDTATVSVIISDSKGKFADKKRHFYLEKVDGKWKLDLERLHREMDKKIAGAIEAISEEEGGKAQSAIETIDENTIKDLK